MLYVTIEYTLLCNPGFDFVSSCVIIIIILLNTDYIDITHKYLFQFSIQVTTFYYIEQNLVLGIFIDKHYFT